MGLVTLKVYYFLERYLHSPSYRTLDQMGEGQTISTTSIRLRCDPKNRSRSQEKCCPTLHCMIPGVKVHQLTPDTCASRLQNMLWLIVGIFLAESAHLTNVARKLPLRAQKLSLDKRLRRFLSHHVFARVNGIIQLPSCCLGRLAAVGNCI
jgi:hypothetical protein